MSQIRIAFAADEHYVAHLAATIASILDNSEVEDEIEIYVMDGGITSESLEKLKSLNQIRPFTLKFLQPDLAQLAKCPEVAYLTKNTYMRLLLPELLPNVDKILYLDCDMIVTCSLRELWETDFQGKSLAAVTDLIEVFPVGYLQKMRMQNRLGLKNPGFNAGMLLINLAKIRDEGLFLKTLRWIEKNPEKSLFGDQDGLNQIFNSDRVVLPFRWNIQIQPGWWQLLDHRQKESLKEWKRIIDSQCGIIHFVSGIKPWQYYYWEAAGKQYWKYLKMTSWNENKPSGNWKTKFLNLLRKNRLYQFGKYLWFRSPFC